MKFAYGTSDFYDIITNAEFYVDRTDRIPLIEEIGKRLLFLRPRRFGKSLLLSMLENYYDVAKADQFEQLFGHLFIGQNPTPRHNRYLVLNWDFSAVISRGRPDDVQHSLHSHINGSIEQFKARYRDILDYNIGIHEHDALRSFQSVLAAVQSSPYNLYLLIDEYDNFANEIMMGSQEAGKARYESLLYGEGALKTVFKVIKSATKGLGLDRIFITGVSPVVMSDITSGHNIAENIYLYPEFHELCGFTEAEIAQPLDILIAQGCLPADKREEALDMMRTFYNGSRFTYYKTPGADTFVYNPTLVIYFLKHILRYHEYPREILDSNLAPDRAKIAYISRLPGGEKVVGAVLDEEQPLSIIKLAQRFGVREMLEIKDDIEFAASLLYYLGVLTLTGIAPTGELILDIPNLVVRRLYLEQLRELLLPDFTQINAERAAKTFYTTGDIQPLCEFMEQRYFRVFDNRDYRWANELTVKTAFLTLLFNDAFYIMDSERALERRYSDLTMIIRPDMRQYQLLDFLIEFKYVELKKNNLRNEQIRQMGREELAALAPVKACLKDARKSLAEYRKPLIERYGEQLRLRVYSVVAVGFERMAWEDVTNF